MTVNETLVVDAFRDGYEGTLLNLAVKLTIPARDVRHAAVPLVVAGIVKRLGDGRYAWNGPTRKKTAP